MKMGVSLVKAARTSSPSAGTAFEVNDHRGAMFVVDAGAWTDGTHTFVFQESDDNSTFTAIADADLDGTEPVVNGATVDDQQYYIGYKGMKKYLRVTLTVAGATTGAIAGAYIVYGFPKDIPTNS